MTLSEIFSVLWARRRRFLTILASLLAFTVLVSLIMPDHYVGEASILLDSTGRDPLFGTVLSSELQSNNVPTQMDVIASHNVALKVVDRFKLIQNPQIQERFQEATGGQGSIRDWMADKLIDHLTINPSRESNVITIDFGATDAESAANIANGFAEAYIQTVLELNMELSRQQANWFDDQLHQLRKNLEAAQKRLADYQQNKNVVTSDDRLDVENAKLAEIANQLVVAQTSMYDAQTRQKQMSHAVERGQIEQLPDILGNGLLQSMKADLTRAQGQLAEVAEHYGHNHPRYISAQAQVRTLEAKLKAEIDTARGSINQTAQIAEQRAKEVQIALDKQKERILTWRGQRNGAEVLTREVDVAQRTYDVASQRANEVRMQSQLNQSNVAILSRAVPPIKPKRPNMPLYLVIAFVAGSMVSAAAVLWREVNDRRACSRELITEITGLAVLAEIPKLKRRTNRKRRLALPRFQTA